MISNIHIFYSDDTTDKLVNTKFYDFQLYFYDSFAHDLIFFLLTSVHSNDLRKDFKLFIEHYHVEFIKTLQFVSCPLDDYTFEK